MDLLARTQSSLDWQVMLDRLAHHTCTQRGRALALGLTLAQHPEEIRDWYQAVAEIRSIENEGEKIPLGSLMDIGPLVARCRRGVILDVEELIEIGHTLGALVHLRGWVRRSDRPLPRLRALISEIELPGELVSCLGRAFDEAGQISGRTYPQIGQHRQRIGQLQTSIRDILEDLLRRDSMKNVLQDRYVTERNGRFVIPVRAGARRGLGIVHGTSQSGETLFIEPAAVVARANDLKELEEALVREERQVRAELSQQVGEASAEIDVALAAAARVDLAGARTALGDELHGEIPQVGSHGVMKLIAARHPVLQLRGVAVVPNDLELDTRRPGLILTGPNAGGKTVALKTLGLSALLTRAGIPVPAAEGSRVDFFLPVLADVGDLQTVEGDLSTFSGHLVVLQHMLSAVGPGALVLLDEVGAGTDPAQGAALARAILEALIDRGARLVVTTHFSELKTLASADPRFRVAAVQADNGRPTYRVEPGVSGPSNALAIARQMKLPDAILERARGLMDQRTRALDERLAQLSSEHAAVRARSEALIEEERQLAERRRLLEEREARVETRRQKLQEEVAKNFRRRIREREDQVKALIAALQTNPGMQLAGQSLARIREIREELDRSMARPEPLAAEPAATRPLQVGDKVHVRSLNRPGIIRAVLPRGRFEVEVGRMLSRLRQDDLRLAGAPSSSARARQPAPLVAPSPVKPPAPAAPRDTSSPGGRPPISGVRTPANTCDLRGQRVEQAIESVIAFLDQQLLSNYPVVFVLHGHGTGALKAAVRSWLPSSRHVSRWRPALPDEGGDAFTIIELVQ